MPDETLPANSEMVPVGAIEVSRALRMPERPIAACTSAGRLRTAGPARYFSASNSGNGPFSTASATEAR